MDNNTGVSTVQRSEPDSEAVSSDAAPTELVGLREWVPRSTEDVKALMMRYAALELHRDPGDVFLQHLLSRTDAWFVEAPFGMFYITDIVPNYFGELAMVFWDQRMPRDRQDFLRTVVHAGFDLFNLERLSCVYPADIKAQTRFLMQSGFTLEARLRNARRTPTGLIDLTVCSILRDEVAAWPSPTISLELQS